MTQTIGIFGLGLIGHALATRLMGHGFRAVGFDPDPEKMQMFEKSGATPCDATDVWAAPIVFAAVFDTAQLETVIDTSPAGCTATLISVSTNDPEQMPEIARRAENRGLTFVEAPLSGTSRDLANGQAVFLIGGKVADYLKLETIFKAISRAQYHVGDYGNGNKTKLAINLVLGLNRAALAEGMVFARSIGLQPAGFLELLGNSAAASAVMKSKGPKMVAEDYTPLGRIAQSSKDFNLIHEAGARAGQGLPFTQTYLAAMQDCIESGEGDLDNAAILKSIARAKPPTG